MGPMSSRVDTTLEYWFGSPYYFSYLQTAEVRASEPNLFGGPVTNVYGVRPSVSLAPGTLYKSGEGTAEDPIIIEY